jgi:hypothetical protein
MAFDPANLLPFRLDSQVMRDQLNALKSADDAQLTVAYQACSPIDPGAEDELTPWNAERLAHLANTLCPSASSAERGNHFQPHM